MPIWSLTRERIDKLNGQIDVKTQEIDALSKLTVEDIWRRDLDDFIEEWRTQLHEEKQRIKDASRQGRRESKKVHVGAAGGRKRKDKDLDDSDFEAGPSKAKKAVSKKDKPVGGILSYLNSNDKEKEKISSKPKAPTVTQKTAQALLDSGAFDTTKEENRPSTDPWLDPMQIDGAGDANKPRKTAVAQPAKKGAAKNARRLSDDETDDAFEEIIAKPAAAAGGRRPRAAASKLIKYDNLTDSDDSDGEGMLFDVGKMVKGIDTAGSSMGDPSSRPLFSTSASLSRPRSSSGLGRKSASALKRDSPVDIDMADDTDYTKLVPRSTSKATNPALNAARNQPLTLDNDKDDQHDSLDEFVFDARSTAVKKIAASPPRKGVGAAKPGRSSKAVAGSSKTVSAAATKKEPTPAPAPAQSKATVLSPAAKAYAAKKAKATKEAAPKPKSKRAVLSDDDSDDLTVNKANDIMEEDGGEESEEPAVAKRPARRAAAGKAKPTKFVDSDDEDELNEDDSEEDSFGGDEDEDDDSF